MIRRANHIEAVARQAYVKCFYKRAGREFGRHEHIAENADALSGNHRLDRMQLVPEAQVISCAWGSGTSRHLRRQRRAIFAKLER